MLFTTFQRVAEHFFLHVLRIGDSLSLQFSEKSLHAEGAKKMEMKIKPVGDK